MIILLTIHFIHGDIDKRRFKLNCGRLKNPAKATYQPPLQLVVFF
jgi:hypothetical protein|tara:strand:+ start:147 stop:281 length:135 start_codon:yes stop_codon:yes gene_type:complete